MKLKDIFIAIIIISIVMLIIIPLNDVIIDVLLSFNIALSIIILLVTLYTKEPLEFSIFPPLLLITTLFRLALNISSTRLILRDGYAGSVIATFGSFVIGDNLIVGFIIFLIIVVIQFMVITKGAERVAEVAARFTLDAMPGKQMAIDADLNSGLINEQQAKQRRLKIQKEADFYGAMDGASKFVKGDAIVGIIITVINIVGGIAIGSLQDNLELTEVINKYTLLTVGDGLVSQIPALIISTASGIIVTRAASDSNLGQDLFKQLSSQPIVLPVAGGTLLILGSIKGMPHVPMYALAILFIYLGYKLKKANAPTPEEEEQVIEQQLEDIRKPENVMSLLNIDPIELEFGYGIIPLADGNQGGDLLDRVVMIRRQCALDLGIIVPIVRLRDNIQLQPNEYIIKIKGIQVARGEVMFDHYMAMNPGDIDEEIPGVKTTEPAFGLPALWITEEQRDKAEMVGYTVVDIPSIISTHLSEIIKRHCSELLTRQEVQNLIDNVKSSYPVVVEELVPKQMSVGEVQKVLANLLRENVPIRDMVTILETLADYINMTRDTDLLTEYVRQALKRVITNRFVEGNRLLTITLDPEVDEYITDAIQQTEQGIYITLEPKKIKTLVSEISKQVNRLVSMGAQPVLLTSAVVRMHIKKLTQQTMPGLIVLSYNELDPAVEIQSIGVVRIS
ncbi:MAG: flagellar biosynthesis protein FlhA [Mahellales bacterium]|jgi:flagellar biosynthesis protein FlhA